MSFYRIKSFLSHYELARVIDPNMRLYFLTEQGEIKFKEYFEIYRVFFNFLRFEVEFDGTYHRGFFEDVVKAIGDNNFRVFILLPCFPFKRKIYEKFIDSKDFKLRNAHEFI